MKRVLVCLSSFFLFIFACRKMNENICDSKLKEIDWQFYMYNAVFNKSSKIPVLDEKGVKVVDYITIHSTSFRRTNFPVYEDSARVDIVFTPKDTLKEYIYAYVNTLRKVKGENVDYVITGDRLGYNIDSSHLCDADRKFKEYLFKYKKELHPCLYDEAVKRGFLSD